MNRPPSDREIAAHVDAVSALLALPIDPAHRPGVERYLALAAAFAGLLDTVPLGPEDESGAVFAPVGPQDEAGSPPASG